MPFYWGRRGKRVHSLWREAAARADIPDDSQAWNALRGEAQGQPPVQLGPLERGPRAWGQGGQGKAEGQEAELRRGSGLGAGWKGKS